MCVRCFCFDCWVCVGRARARGWSTCVPRFLVDAVAFIIIVIVVVILRHFQCLFASLFINYAIIYGGKSYNILTLPYINSVVNQIYSFNFSLLRLYVYIVWVNFYFHVHTYYILYFYGMFVLRSKSNWAKWGRSAYVHINVKCVCWLSDDFFFSRTLPNFYMRNAPRNRQSLSNVVRCAIYACLAARQIEASIFFWFGSTSDWAHTLSLSPYFMQFFSAMNMIFMTCTIQLWSRCWFIV